MGFQKGNQLGKLNKGRKHTEESKFKMGESHKGHVPWNKGISWTEDVKRKISKTKKYGWQEGKYKLNIGNFKKGEHRSLNTEFKRGNKTWNTGIKMSEEFGRLISKRLRGRKQPIKEIEKRRKSITGLKRTDESKERYRLSKLGNKNPSKKPEVRQKQRIIRAKQIIENGGGPNLGLQEKQILDFIEEDLFFNRIKIIRQYPVSGYFVDGYIKELNLVVEVDEKPKVRIKDIEREEFIKNKLNCQFMRIPTYG